MTATLNEIGTRFKTLTGDIIMMTKEEAIAYMAKEFLLSEEDIRCKLGYLGLIK